MEEIIIIIEVADTVTKGLAPLVIAGIASAIPGIAKGIGSLFGGGKRRRRERRAKKEYQNQLSGYKNFQFENPYEDLQNTFEGMENQFEDMRVATQAAEFQSQQQQQGLAQTLDALRGAGGGTGAAAIAQALSQSQARGQQQIAANIEQQERQNELAVAQAGMDIQRQQAQAGMQLQMAEASGAQAVQQQEFGRQSTLLGMSQQELAGARQARAQATADLGAGLGAVGGLALGGAFKGLFGGSSPIGGGTGFAGAMKDYSSFGQNITSQAQVPNLTGNPFQKFLNN